MAADFRGAGHLPQGAWGAGRRRPATICRASGAGSTPQMHGRYPDYDVLDGGASTGTR